MKQLVILDRDGVINTDSPHYIKSPEEWHPIPGSLEAIARLNQAGFLVAVATNQSGVARGFYSLETLEKIHQKMQTECAQYGGTIEAIFFCAHGPEEGCDCRKPKPGLYHQIARHFNVDLKETAIPAIGDSLRDLEAAKASGCLPVLVLTGNGKKTQQNLPPEFNAIPIYGNLALAVEALLNGELS